MVVVAAIAGLVIIAAAVAVPVVLLNRGGPSSPVGVVSSPNPGPSTGAATQARTLYQEAVSATTASAGFHYVAVSGGPEPQTITGDAGRANGRQDITFASTFGSEKFTLLLVGGTVYFQGNVPALEDQLGVPAEKAAAVSGQWVTVVHGDGPYSVVAPGITVADQATEMTLVPTSTTNVTTAGGAPATRILGTTPAQQGAPAGTARLDIDPTSHLPITYESTLTDNGVSLGGTTTFSAWGTAPTVTAPAGAVAWSTLGASQPPGGYGGGGGPGSGPSPTTL